MAEDAKCISGTESGKQYGTRTDDKTHQTARGGKLFAEMQASKELGKRRKTPEQKGVTSTTILEEENTALKEQVSKLKEQIQLLMTSSQEHGAASSAESSAEWQKLAGRKQ